MDRDTHGPLNALKNIDGAGESQWKTPVAPRWFDWLIYRLFMWRWNRILGSNPMMAMGLARHLEKWTRLNHDEGLCDAIEEILGTENANFKQP